MIKNTSIQLNVMKGPKQFVHNHQPTPANAVVTATTTALGNSITTIETLDAGWDQGIGTFHGATEERQFAKAQLRQALSALEFGGGALNRGPGAEQ